MFAVRIMVDVVIRAVSPAVNDRTAAVRVLGVSELWNYSVDSDLAGSADRQGIGRPSPSDHPEPTPS